MPVLQRMVEKAPYDHEPRLLYGRALVGSGQRERGELQGRRSRPHAPYGHMRSKDPQLPRKPEPHARGIHVPIQRFELRVRLHADPDHARTPEAGKRTHAREHEPHGTMLRRDGVHDRAKAILDLRRLLAEKFHCEVYAVGWRPANIGSRGAKGSGGLEQRVAQVRGKVDREKEAHDSKIKERSSFRVAASPAGGTTFLPVSTSNDGWRE